MSMPNDLPQYLQEIQIYLEGHRSKLQSEWKKQNGEYPSEDTFPELTKAISCIQSLQPIQKTILKYWEDLND